MAENFDRYKYFVYNYRLLYKALQQEDPDPEDVQRWRKLAEEAVRSIEQILADGSVTRWEKQSYEASLGHFLSILLQLDQRAATGSALSDQQGGEIQQHAPVEPSVRWSEVQSAFACRIRSGVITNVGHLDLKSFMDDAKEIFESKVKAVLEEYEAIKVNTVLSAEYILTKIDQQTLEVKHFNTKNESIFQTTDIRDWFDEYVQKPLETEMEDFQEKDSGWSLVAILHLTVNINKLNPMRGSSHIPLPKPIENKRACINIINDLEAREAKKM